MVWSIEQSVMKHMDHGLEIQDIGSNRSFLKEMDSILFYSYIIASLHMNSYRRL
jgi:hypothetical protein